jgi:hypothetical protein
MTSTANITGTAPRTATTRQLAEFRAALEEQRQFRLTQLDDLTTRGPDGPALPPDDPLDDVSNAMRVGATLALDEIDAALQHRERTLRLAPSVRRGHSDRATRDPAHGGVVHAMPVRPRCAGRVSES